MPRRKISLAAGLPRATPAPLGRALSPADGAQLSPESGTAARLRPVPDSRRDAGARREALAQPVRGAEPAAPIGEDLADAPQQQRRHAHPHAAGAFG